MILRLPLAYGNAVTAQGDTRMTPAALAFAEVWLARLGDRAARMVCDDRLVVCAQQHAEFLAERTPAEQRQSMHVGRGGTTPNQRVRMAGYRLLAWHGNKNTVESCTRSWDALAETVDDLMASPSHHDHLWGVGWYAEHTVWGIGAAAEYFVVVICPRESDLQNR